MFIFFTLSILAVSLWGIKYSHEWNENYCGKDQSNAIKGIFILILTVGHISYFLYRNGLYPNTLGDKIDLAIHSSLNQLVVVMFLFFSGYGISERIKKDKQNGGGYIVAIPQHRVLPILLNFDIAVIIYMLFSPFTGGVIVLADLPLYFVGLKRCINPSWYIVVILLCYLASWFSAALINNSRKILICFQTIIIFIIGLLLSFFMEEHWYSTIMCYPFGFAYSQYKMEFEQVIKKKYFLTLFMLVISFCIIYQIVQYSGNTGTIARFILFNVLSILFAFLIIVLSLKLKIGNKAIIWCGKHLFPIYIYQNLFFHSLYNIGGNNHSIVLFSPFLYAIISIVLTLITASLYRYWEIKLK